METSDELYLQPTAHDFQLVKHLLAKAIETEHDDYAITRELVRAADKLLQGTSVSDAQEDIWDEINDLYADVQEGTPYHFLAATVNAKAQALYELKHTIA